jgi:hypothetical protein
LFERNSDPLLVVPLDIFNVIQNAHVFRRILTSLPLNCHVSN